MANNLKLDANTHDIIIGRGATRVGGAEQVAQLCKCRLLTLLGEWKLDTSLGLPWFEAILTKNVREADIQTAISGILAETNGVQKVISVDIDADFKMRLLTVNFTALSDYGDISEFVEWQPSNMV